MSPARVRGVQRPLIAGFQNALLLAITLPAWRARSTPRRPLGMLDAIAIALFVSAAHR